MPGPVGGVAGAREAGPAERALRDAPVGEPAEVGAPVLHLEDSLRRLPREDLRARLVGQIVGTLDGVEGVSLPRVVAAVRVVAERGVDSALGRAGVRPYRVDLRHDRDVASRIVHGDRRSEAGQAAADYQCIVMYVVGHALSRAFPGSLV